MWKISLAVAALSWLAGTFPAASEGCRQETRTVELDKQNTVPLKSYMCTAGEGANESKFSVEFHEFSNVAAAMVVGASPASKLLGQTIGSPTVVKNRIFTNYADLVARFGEVYALRGDLTRTVFYATPAGSVLDTAPGSKLRALTAERDDSFEYPNPDDIQPLLKKQIPASLRYYYSVSCDDKNLDASKASNDCRKFNNFGMRFWRPMVAADSENFRKNLAAYNSLLKINGNRKNSSEGLRPLAVSAGERYLKLVHFVAGSNWPEDFVILTGTKEDAGCGGIPGLNGWIFRAFPREIVLDAVLITNKSDRPLTINGLFGISIDTGGLRVATRPSSGAGNAPIEFTPQTLEAGKRLLVPTRISFPVPQSAKDLFQFSGAAATILKESGTNGFSGAKASFGAPTLKTYAYDSEIAIAAISVNGARLALEQRRTNFIDLTASLESGSCPYLLAFSTADQAWVNNGKVLHLAPGKDREYLESRMFPGLTSRFRIEEREAERAYIDSAELKIVLKKGAIVTLQPALPSLRARDGDYLQLDWGEAEDVTFAIPSAIVEEDVAASHFSVTGYYERYGGLSTMNDSADESTLQSHAPGNFSPLASFRNKACSTVIARAGASFSRR